MNETTVQPLRRRSGRIYPGMRVPAAATATVNDDNNIDSGTATQFSRNLALVQLNQEDEAAIARTMNFSMKEATRNEHRNRLKRMMEWIKERYPTYANEVIREITQAELGDPKKHFYKNTHDFIYDLLDPTVIRAFLTSVQTHPDGKSVSFTHIRKFHDAILFGAVEQGTVLSPTYYITVENFLKSFKKQNVQAKREGLTDEKDADPMPFALYVRCAQWAIQAGDIFCWTFLIISWHCLGRTSSVDILGLHNLNLGVDSIILKYDDSKMDGAGEKVSPKNCYANPYDPRICLFLSLGIWIMLHTEQFNTSDKLFLKPTTKNGTSSKLFGTHLIKVLEPYHEEIATFACPERIQRHSTRKGSATHVTSATTEPPPLPSVARRGEWSQGAIWDVYLQFAEPGDHYLGRMLAGLDSTLPSFAILPPHFTCGIENEDIKTALNFCFGSIIQKHGNHLRLTGVLLLLLASVVYHEEYLHDVIARNPRHPFNNISLFRYPDLVKRLRDMITTEPTENMPRPTGIPNHIKQAETLQKLFNASLDILGKIQAQSEDLQKALAEAIHDIVRQSGTVTVPILMEHLQQHYDSIKELIELNLGVAGNGANNNNANNIVELPPPVDNLMTGGPFPAYCYNGAFWDVPKNWQLPKKINGRLGWVLWIKGDPTNEVLVGEQRRLAPVMPFQKLKVNRIPISERDHFKVCWQPIFKTMEECPDLNIPVNQEALTPVLIDELYNKATDYLKTRAGYVWQLERVNSDEWAVSTWSRHVTRALILANGTALDIANLPPETAYNKRKRQQNVVEVVVRRGRGQGRGRHIERGTGRGTVRGRGQGRGRGSSVRDAGNRNHGAGRNRGHAGNRNQGGGCNRGRVGNLRVRTAATAVSEEKNNDFDANFHVPEATLDLVRAEMNSMPLDVDVVNILNERRTEQLRRQSTDPGLLVRYPIQEGIPDASRQNNESFTNMISDTIDTSM
jgi:hypothetical protein